MMSNSSGVMVYKLLQIDVIKVTLGGGGFRSHNGLAKNGGYCCVLAAGAFGFDLFCALSFIVMEKLTFEQLPEAIALLIEKVSRLETLLENLPREGKQVIRMLNVTEAAELLHISVQSLYTKVSRREIPVHKPGKRLYFNRQELLEWMMSSRLKTVAEIQWEAEQHLAELGRKRKARRL